MASPDVCVSELVRSRLALPERAVIHLEELCQALLAVHDGLIELIVRDRHERRGDVGDRSIQGNTPSSVPVSVASRPLRESSEGIRES